MKELEMIDMKHHACRAARDHSMNEKVVNSKLAKDVFLFLF